jgi:hypothetical protein
MPASLSVEQMEFLASKGLSFEDAIAFAKLSDKPKSKAAERTARWRAKKNGGVTGDVTRDASPPPIEDHTPPVSSDEETSPAAKVTKLVPRPEGVSEQTWRDFVRCRNAQRAPITPTAVAGIAREAAKAGWALEAAISESVSRGWRGFKAEWVRDDGKPPGSPASMVDQILAGSG